MNILIVGSGGREHALAWKIAQSPRLTRLYVAPGNAGTAHLGDNISISAGDVPALVQFACERRVDLVVIGPEAALAAGLADQLQEAGIPAFGPSQLAAEIETSKAFSKHFMHRHGIPTARFAVFTQYKEACDYVARFDSPVVIKSSGLAAGKGVVLPGSPEEARIALKAMMVDRAFGPAGEKVVIEERLSGPEVSLLAFTDSLTIRPMPPAQDHKRLLDDDEGHNTGGMGAYAPAPVCPPALVDRICAEILQPAVDGLRAEGRPFVGVLYAGLMLTARGPVVLEFNARFGDPETQVILPLLQTDLLDIFEACVRRRLDQVTPVWKPGAAATVVLASAGYPGNVAAGKVITGLDGIPDPAGPEQVIVFHAGTRQEGDQVLTAGGRVLNVTGAGPTLRQAIATAYEAVSRLHFDGMQYRRDIGRRALHEPLPPGNGLPAAGSVSATGSSSAAGSSTAAYTASGVNIDAGNRAVELMRSAVRSTYTPAVLGGIGAFGGLYDATALQGMRNPVLVASTDGVGTKVRLAAEAGRYTTIGMDIVNHCVNDILVQGARPLFFLDYFASARLDPTLVARVVEGIALACREAGCVLIGGETAEMPGVYGPGEFDLAGTIVGVVERDQVLPREDLHPGDLLVGLASNGPHTNGYSLIRKVFAGVSLDTVFPQLGLPLKDALLAPHRSYLPALEPALAARPALVKALAHLTGGGWVENIPRVLPDHLRAVIHPESWPVPPLFTLIAGRGQVSRDEMFRVFNMGIGMVAVVAPDQFQAFQQAVPEPVYVVGELVPGEKGVTLP